MGAMQLQLLQMREPPQVDKATAVDWCFFQAGAGRLLRPEKCAKPLSVTCVPSRYSLCRFLSRDR